MTDRGMLCGIVYWHLGASLGSTSALAAAGMARAAAHARSAEALQIRAIGKSFRRFRFGSAPA
jgi:hypothetical protein